MKFLALENDKPGGTGGQSAPFLEAEARAVWSLMQAGVLREIYFREDRTQAVLILEAPSRGAVQEELARLPLVAAGLTEFEVIGLQPYPGLARLFRRS